MSDIEKKKEKRSAKVGIVGYWYATNYGSVMTYYALYRTIEKMGYEPILIDEVEKSSDPAGEDSFPRVFIREYCKVSESVKWEDVRKLNDLCDTFVVGSDQVWTQGALRTNRGMFFLNFADCGKKKMAYASSFGTDRFMPFRSRDAEVRGYLRQFDKISVREDHGREVMKKRYFFDSDQVFDPTFLLDRDEYSELADRSHTDTSGKYILAYILDPDPDKEKAISILEKKLEVPVKLVLDGRYGTFNDNVRKLTVFSDSIVANVSEWDWFKLFRDAEFVITDSHHGMALAILFRKRFITYANRSRGYERFTSLLSLLGIDGRLVDNSADITDKVMEEEIDYRAVSKRIEKEKKHSLDWLRDGLENGAPKRSVPYNLDLKDRCCGCSTCMNVCPKDAIIMEKNPEGFLNPKVDKGKCIDCGLCTECCPVLHPTYLNNPNPPCYALMADDVIRSVSSSGGAFTLAARKILSEGGSVFGVKFDRDFNVVYTEARDEISLAPIRGSKYYQADPGTVYRRVRSVLEEEKPVLFTGMPCHIAALKSFLRKDYSKLTTIDILCHGISSKKVFDKYRKDVFGPRGEDLTDLQFKAKKPWGWHAGINASFKDGSTYSCIIETDPFFVSYIHGISKNTCCGICPFNRLPRQADITIGDFWKIQVFDPKLNDNKGTSMVLANTGRGRDFLEGVKSEAAVFTEVPIEYAIAGNGIIKFPYRLNPARDYFFDRYETLDFGTLVKSIMTPKIDKPPASMPEMYRDTFYVAKIVADNCKGRKIVVWGDNWAIRNMMKKYFGLDVFFSVTSDPKYADGIRIHNIEDIEGMSNDYYIVAYGRSYNVESEELLKKYGYAEVKDYVFRVIKPIVLENRDFSKQPYSDMYGNVITAPGPVGRIVLAGGNNRIFIDGKVWGLSKLEIRTTSNVSIKISSGANFTQPNTEIDIQGYSGSSRLVIGRCRFMESLIRLFNNPAETKVMIGNGTTFGDNLRIHANSGKNVYIGDDCLFSRDVTIWSGDGHTMFDVRTGKNINSADPSKNIPENMVAIGDHVWVGDGSLILNRSNIGDGSIVGAKATVKNSFPNNCSIIGNPARIAKRDVAWCHEMSATDISSCGRFARLTSDSNAPITGLNVLVIGGSKNNGKGLVNELLRRHNSVTIANRGKTHDGFGNMVSRITLDVSEPESVKKVLKGKYFDVVFNNLAYCSEWTRNVLSNIDCGKLVQLSSMAVYHVLHDNVRESEFDPAKERFGWHGMGDYGAGKRESECVAIQNYPDLRPVLVRIPYVLDTDRFDYYCDAIANGKEILTESPERKMPFITSSQVGKFLVWAAAQDYSGPINISNKDVVTEMEIIRYIESKLGKKARIISSKGNKTGFLFVNNSLSLEKAENLGYHAEELDDVFWRYLDSHIAKFRN